MSELPDLAFDQLLSLVQGLSTDDQARLIDVLLRGKMPILSALERKVDVTELREASALLQFSGTWVGDDVRKSLDNLAKMRMSEQWG